MVVSSPVSIIDPEGRRVLENGTGTGHQLKNSAFEGWLVPVSIFSQTLRGQQARPLSLNSASQPFTHYFLSHGPTMKRFLVFVLFLLAFYTLVVGCGGDRQTYANVKGTVTYNDKPLDKGEVIFTVEGRPPAIIEVTDGKFAGQALVGSNKVSVSARQKTGKKRNYPATAEDMRRVYKASGKGNDAGAEVEYDVVDYIPAEWGSASKHMYVVETGAANEFNLSIKGPNKG
jgi:hypothetical protein